jgi:hypothetical protein
MIYLNGIDVVLCMLIIYSKTCSNFTFCVVPGKIFGADTSSMTNE